MSVLPALKMPSHFLVLQDRTIVAVPKGTRARVVLPAGSARWASTKMNQAFCVRTVQQIPAPVLPVHEIFRSVSVTLADNS